MPATASLFAADLRVESLPRPLTELCAHLEERGIKVWLQGDGLLDEMAPSRAAAAWGGDRKRTHGLLCAATGEALLRALPHAVVTTACQARLTQATAWGPVDLIPLGDTPLESVLSAFGLSALAIGFRPAKTDWVDVGGALEQTRKGVLGLPHVEPNPFAEAPRRYWIAARLIGEYGLEPSDALLNSARGAFPEAVDALPLGASARRMVDRVLACAQPGPALAFLRESGVTAAVFPGATAENEALIAALPPQRAVRWAAWLRGSATQRGLVRLRTPHALARRIERVQEAHPLDRSVESLREASIRRVLKRLERDELEALFAWRRLELARASQAGESAEAQRIEERLAGLETRIAETEAAAQRSGTVRALALDGAGVMATLNVGPGRHIGLALAHLAHFIEAHPDKNERAELEQELRDWASRNPQKIR